MDLSGEFRDRATVDAARRQEFDDLNIGLAGLNTGRQTRFLNSGSGGVSVGGKDGKAGADRLYQTLRWMLENDLVYARLHERAMTSLRDTADTARDLIEQIEHELAQAQTAMADILDRAATLPDGTKVFRDKNGIVRGEDGERIADDLAATIEWRGNEPGFDEYQAAADRIDTLEQAANEVRGIETELGGYQDELTNEESPPSKERVQEITDRTESMRAQMREIQNNAVSVASEIDSSADSDRDPGLSNTASSIIPAVSFGSQP